MRTWQRKPLTYDICIPPISKPFDAFSSEEAKEFFDWYIGKIPERIQYLSNRCARDLGISVDRINLQPESLPLVWKWFLSVADTEKTESNELQLNLQTEYIIRDIGMYVGEMFHSNYRCIQWSYYETPKTDFFVNMPLLVGFEDDCVSPPFHAVFEPIHMVGVQACRILDNRQKEDDLLNMCKIWIQKIPQNT